MRRFSRVAMTLLFPVSLLTALLPLVQFGPARLSLLDLGHLMLGHMPILPLYSEILTRLGVYLTPFLYPVIVLAGAVLLAALVSLFLPEKGAFYLALVFPPVLNVGVFFLFQQMWEKLEEVRPALPFFSLEDTLTLQGATVLIWGLIWVLIILLALLGLSLALAAQAQTDWTDILPEMIDPPTGPERDADEQQYRQQVETLERTPPSPEPFPREETPSSSPAPACGDFSGAVLGQSGRFLGMAYPLQERRAVYFTYDGREVFLRDRQGLGALAEVYYVKQYQEYCLQPLERQAVFLVSGQPLGAGRRYFLPRGTELYLLGQGHAFSLA